MKLTIDARLLADAVAWAARALSQKPAVPALAGLLLDADAKDTLTISAFDYDLSGRIRLDCDVAEPGRVLLSGRVLLEVAKRLPDRFVAELIAAATDVTLACGPAEFSLPAMNAEDYPSLPEPPATVGTVDGETLARAVGQVLPALDPHSAEPMLTAIRLDVAGPRLTLGASNAHVLAVRELAWDAPANATADAVLVPGIALQGVTKTLTGPVSIGIDDSTVSVTAGDRQSVMRRLDAKSRDYRVYVAAVKREHTATVDREPLVEAIGRVGVMAEKNTAVRLAFGGGVVEVRAGGGEGGKGREVVPATLEGLDAIEFGFFPHVISAALAGISHPVVRLSMSLPAKPVHLCGLDADGAEDEAMQAVAMPLRTT